MRTHAGGGKIFKTTSGVVACSIQFGMAVACPLAVAHIKEHCKEVGATPGTPMQTPFVLTERLVSRPGAQRNLDDSDSGV
jgi:hypothetical protein